jgi:hypothetical protein
MMKSILACLLLVLPACAGDGGDDAGTGSSTLRIDADFEASPEIWNASAAGDFTTELRVTVTKDGVPVTTGEVIVGSAGGDVALIYTTTDSGGRWRGVQAGYHASYELHVTSGDDYVHGVRVVGPDVHVFTAPIPDQAIDATVPLTVTWSRDAQADDARIETRELDATSIPDTGSYLLAAGTLRSKPDEAEQEELRVRRASRVAPAGAVAGSSVRVAVENRLELVIAPTGL